MTDNMSMILDEQALTVRVNPATGVVSVDGIPVFRAFIAPDGSLIIEFKDWDKLRIARCNRSFVRVPLEALFSALNDQVP